MPTYSYRCTECDNAFDIVQSFSDDALTVCPECGGTLRKVYNAVGVVFKGTGFYRTDSRGSSTTASTTPKKSDSSSATSSTSTPASTPSTGTSAS